MKGSSDSSARSRLPIRKRFAFYILLIVITIVILEAGLHLLHYLTHLDQARVPDPKMLLSPYRDEPWAEKYWTEAQQREIQYEAYYGWSYKEFQGDYVNIDKRGLRKTFNPEFSSTVTPETLFVFGGSTIWGDGSRDDYTVPSHLSRMLNERGHRVHVENYGCTGYVFTQEVIRLFIALREGHRPDYVIFYSGTNDVYSAYQSGVAGTLQNIERTRSRLEKITAGDHIKLGLRRHVQENSMIYRAIRKVKNILVPAGEDAETAARFTESEISALAGEIRRAYAESRNLLQYLSETYEFDYLCFLQPIAFLEPRLNDEEARCDKRLRNKVLAGFFTEAYDSLRAGLATGAIDLSDVLAERKETIYIDFCHISEEGNRIVATRICDILAETFFNAGRDPER